MILSRKWLCFLPMYHAMAQTIFIAGGPKRRIPVYIMKKFDFIQVLEAIQKYKITALPMVPPIVVVRHLSLLASNPRRDCEGCLNKVLMVFRC
jgi:acyl-CoA synthetase (AMP-forming)/AMP-acid ligase II